jgi:hypothetical protein
MNKFKARKDNTTDDRREDRDNDGPNVLHKNASSRRQAEHDEQRSAQPKQKEPEYKPKHGKKWPAVLLTGAALLGAYQIGTHGGFEKTLHLVGTYLVQKTTQPSYNKVAAEHPEAAHYTQAPVQHTVVEVIRTPNRYAAAQPSIQETALNMKDKLLETRLHMVYQLDQEKMAFAHKLLRDRYALAQEEAAQQGVVNQSYAAENYSYAAENNSYALANGAYAVVNTVNAFR